MGKCGRVTGALTLLIIVLVGRTIWMGRRVVEKEVCGTDEEAVPVGDLQYGRLANAIRIRTVSTAPGNVNTSALAEFQLFLRKEYPPVFTCPYVKHEVISNYSILLEVSGKNSALMPYLLMSHIDVVPAVSAEWQVEPFAGRIDDEFIWGRGAIDVKDTLMGIMEVLDFMIKSNQQPQRSFYISFGHDEEISGIDGAQKIAPLLYERGVRFLFILDEGLPIAEDIIVPGQAAMVGMGEKGFLTLRLSVNMTGGHSAVPAPESALSVMARAVAKLSQSPHPHHFGQGVEVDMLQQLVPSLPWPMKIVASNLWLFKPIVAWSMMRKGETAAMLRTSTAVTIFQSGIKANVIPGYASATVNHRVHQQDSMEDVIARNIYIIGDDRVDVEVVEYSPATPLASVDSDGFKIITKSVKQVFDNIPVAPALCIGNTDARFFHDLSDNIFRFAPAVYRPGDSKRFHGPNERISKKNYAQLVNFFHHVIKNADKVDPPAVHPPHDL